MHYMWQISKCFLINYKLVPRSANPISWCFFCNYEQVMGSLNFANKKYI